MARLVNDDELSARILETLVEAGQKIVTACKTYAATQIVASLIPASDERRGEPTIVHWLKTETTHGTPIGTIACNSLVSQDTVVDLNPASVTCPGCRKTVAYKAAAAR